MVEINEAADKLRGDDVGPGRSTVSGFPDGRTVVIHEYKKTCVRIPRADRHALRNTGNRDGIKAPGSATIGGFNGKRTRQPTLMDRPDPYMIRICDGVVVWPVAGTGIVKRLRDKLTHTGKCQAKKNAGKNLLFHGLLCLIDDNNPDSK